MPSGTFCRLDDFTRQEALGQTVSQSVSQSWGKRLQGAPWTIDMAFEAGEAGEAREVGE